MSESKSKQFRDRREFIVAIVSKDGRIKHWNAGLSIKYATLLAEVAKYYGKANVTNVVIGARKHVPYGKPNSVMNAEDLPSES